MLAKRPEQFNITVNPELKDEWNRYAERQGIRFSPWIAAKMKEFIEEQKELEELRKNKK